MKLTVQHSCFWKEQNVNFMFLYSHLSYAMNSLPVLSHLDGEMDAFQFLLAHFSALYVSAISVN